MGKVVSHGCSMRDILKNPSSNCVVDFNKRVTKNAKLHGRMASTLNAQRCGPEEWWVLLVEKRPLHKNISC